MYSLWRGGKCLGHFEEKGPVTRRGRRSGAFGILVPAERMDRASSMMQTRIAIFPGEPTFQSPIPIEWVGNPPEAVTPQHQSSGALEPLSPEAARGVPPDAIYEIRDDRGERVDAHMVVLQLHRFAASADAEEWRAASGFDGDRREYWTVSFATRLPDGEETTVVRPTDEQT